MTVSSASIENGWFLEDFDLLAKPGVVGLFDGFELIEVIRYIDGKPEPTNVFTIAVALEKGEARKAVKLNDQRIRANSIKGHSFGVFRSVLGVDAFRQALENYLTTQIWQPNGVSVSIGRLEPVARRFVPPSGSTEVPLNRVLKNNFFNGSYVLELFDVDKPSLQDLFETPTALLQLSEAVSGLVPLGIAGLADRLGNIIVQFPVEAVRARFGNNGSCYTVEIAWHSQIAERQLTATAYDEHDKLAITFGQEQVASGVASVCADPDYGLLHGTVWDNENRVLLAATAGDAFIKTMALNMAMQEHEPRLIPESIDASEAKTRIKLTHPSNLSLVGKDPKRSITEPIGRRIYEEELATLRSQRKFLQYGARPRSGASDRQKALSDVRSLIASYGANSVWLWDPFLAPQDILDTLFYNPTVGTAMKALTLLKVPVSADGEHEGSTKEDRRKTYGEQLSNLPGNFHGLNIEFRSAHGPSGWDFHDRFLIFPKSADDRAKAWSLGTSVNSLGKSHHILQQVENAQLIADAFQLLWDAVAHRENVVWTCP